jgi:hypothetical protein
MTENGKYCWDLTFSFEKNQKENIKEFCTRFAKKWGFQLEEGDKTKYLHFQSRISLEKKKRKGELASMLKEAGLVIHGDAIKVTSTKCSKDAFWEYTTKEFTRIEGPWTSLDCAKYIPRQFRDLDDKLYPWQQEVKDISNIFDTRKINIIIDYDGNNGKSTIAHHLRLTMNGICLPICNDGEKIIQSCCNILTSKNVRNTIPIFIDLPRAMDKTRLYGIYTAIEQVKSGWVYDVRNQWKEWDYDSPVIWVTTNRAPEENWLTKDRWNLYAITPEKKLKKIFFGGELEALAL